MNMLNAAPGRRLGRSPADAASTPGSSVFTAVEQLGLKLESHKALVETVIVEHVEKTPAQN